MSFWFPSFVCKESLSYDTFSETIVHTLRLEQHNRPKITSVAVGTYIVYLQVSTFLVSLEHQGIQSLWSDF